MSATTQPALTPVKDMAVARRLGRRRARTDVVIRTLSLAATGIGLLFLASILVIAVFYYPTTFGPEQQTVFGWFENDVYVGLLAVATYLGVARWRGTVIRPS